MTRNVLIVDDSATVRQVLKMTLFGAGYQIVEAADGLDALDCLYKNEIDMLITDLNMPRMDGIELITRVRKTPGNRFMPIVMLTTESQPEQKKKGKEAGASGWVTKPFKPEQMLSLARMVCPIN